MPSTIDQRLQRALMRAIEDPETPKAQKAAFIGYLVEMRRGKMPRAVKKAADKKGPLKDLGALLGTAKPAHPPADNK